MLCSKRDAAKAMQQAQCSKHKARHSKCKAAGAMQSSKSSKHSKHSRRQWGSMLSKMAEDAVARQVIIARQPWQILSHETGIGRRATRQQD